MVHGFMSPATVEPEASPSLGERWHYARTHYGWFFVVVALPCLAAALYLYAFAADQYESEAHYLVRAQGAPASSGSSIEKLLGASGGGGGGGQGEANSVADFLLSHDAVDALGKQSGLVERFRRPEADRLSRLASAEPTPKRCSNIIASRSTSTTTPTPASRPSRSARSDRPMPMSSPAGCSGWAKVRSIR